jgi:hypothetical protein
MAVDPVTGRWTPDISLWEQQYEDLPEESFLSQAGMADWAERTMAEDYAQIMAGLPSDPRFARGFRSMMPSLQGRYMLAQPFMGMGTPGADPAGALGQVPPTFAQYVSDIGQPTAYDVGQTGLRQRAQLAADVAMGIDPGPTAVYGATNPARLAYEGYFGSGQEGARENRMAVAQMLARQREGGGQYRGTLGRAIGAGIERLSQRRLAQGAAPNSFLDWYLSQTAQ